MAQKVRNEPAAVVFKVLILVLAKLRLVSIDCKARVALEAEVSAVSNSISFSLLKSISIGLDHSSSSDLQNLTINFSIHRIFDWLNTNEFSILWCILFNPIKFSTSAVDRADDKEAKTHVD